MCITEPDVVPIGDVVPLGGGEIEAAGLPVARGAVAMAAGGWRRSSWQQSLARLLEQDPGFLDSGAPSVDKRRIGKINIESYVF